MITIEQKYYSKITVFVVWVILYQLKKEVVGKLLELVQHLLHFLNSLLVFLLVIKITRSSKGAFWASLIFLVHPVQVESVAWISERKNLLSFLFFVLSFLTYLRGGTRVLSLLLFSFACLAKSTVVILPLLLILYDV